MADQPKRPAADRSDARPFTSHWLDSAYQETVLHNAPWDSVKKKICDALAKKIEKQCDEPERMQMIFELVGTEFKSLYFPDLSYEPLLLHKPNLNNEQLTKLRGEAQSWLGNQAQKVAKEVGCGRVPPGTTPGDDLSSEQLEFLQRTYEIFLKNLDRYMVQKEADENKKLHESSLENERIVKEQEEKAKVMVQYRSASTVSSVPSSAISRKDTTLTQTIRKMVGPEPNYHCFQTETVAQSVKEILQRDPKRFTDVAQRLHGRQLGATLRTYCWLDVLFKADRDSLREGNVEKLVRTRFINHVRRGVIDLSVKMPTNSPISGLIENAVVETYSKTLAMRAYNHDNHLKDAARALNVLYVYDRTYEPYLVHWIFPLQIAMRDHAGSPEYPYELAMYLDLLNKSCFPNWPRIFAMADKSLVRLANLDGELYRHLKKICLEDVEIDPKDFMVYLIHEEREKAQALLNLPPQSAESVRMSKELLADALIFLRKWIGEGFVSVLDTPAVLFLWDQNFLQYWQGETIENMCLTLLELLRYKFMEATNYKEMKHVFLDAPGKLYTADIQKGWIHIERGGNPLEVQYFNRQRPIVKTLKEIDEELEPIKTPLRFVDEGNLQYFHIKNITVKLRIPAERFYKETWLVQFDPDNIKMMFVLYFGDQKVAHRLSDVKPTVRLSTQDDNKIRTITLEYSEDILLFDHDQLLEKYHVLEDSVPFISVRIDFLKITERLIQPQPLAWAKVDTHRKKPVNETVAKGKYVTKENEQFDWLVNSRPVQLDLAYGPMPQCIIAVPPKPAPKVFDSPLASESRIEFTIVDPSGASSEGKSETVTQDTAVSTPRAEEPQGEDTDLSKHWVEHDPTVSVDDTDLNLDLTEAFDVYIDELRFLPDTATIVKITGRFLKTGEVTNIPDIAAYPESESNPKQPVFNFRMVVNDSRHNLSEEALLILRVYTVDKHSKDLVVIGSCLLKCVNDDGKINTGGFQLRLRNGMPDISQGIQSLLANSMDNIPSIPSASILVRILPHEPGYRVMPEYTSRYYESSQSNPNQSEWNIFEKFTNDTMRQEFRWTEVIAKLKKDEGDVTQTTTLGVRPYMEERMDPKRYLPPQTPAGNLDIKQSVRYRIEAGLTVKLRAFGLQEGLWSQCLVYVQEGPRAVAKRLRQGDAFASLDKQITRKLDYSAVQKAPRWNDNLKFYPIFDTNSFLVIELHGLKFHYKSQASPKIVGAGGRPLSEQDLTNAWAVVPLFINEATMTGEHLVPMFKGLPDDDVLQSLATEPLKKSLKNAHLQKYQSACFQVKLFDAHFVVETDFPLQPLPTYKTVVDSVGDSGYARTSKDESGKILSDMILLALPPEQAKAGQFGANFEREKRTFDETAHETIVDMLRAIKRIS